MRIILIALIMAFAVSNGYAQEIYKTTTVFRQKYDNATMPIDIVFHNKNNFMVYDAIFGKILDYQDGKHKRNYINKALVDGNCFVKIGEEYFFCDTKKSRILKFDKNINPTGEMKSESKFDPTDVILQKNRFVVVDNNNNRLAIFKKNNSKFLGYIGSGCGDAKGCLFYPFTIVQDKDGYTYVSEVMNTRVQMFTDSFKPVAFIGEWGVNAGQFFRPKGLGLIKNKYLIVSDGYIGVLQVFDKDGVFLGVIGDDNGAIRRYQSPTRIRVYENYIGVVDPYERVVDIIELGELK